MLNRYIIWIGLLLAVNITCYAGSPPNPPIYPMMTIPMQQYMELENELQNALLEKDIKKLKKLVAADFEVRNGLNPADVHGRDTWFKQMFGRKIASEPRISQIAARELNGFQVVSFLSQTSKLKFFIIDIWTNKAKNSQLITRYATPLVQ